MALNPHSDQPAIPCHDAAITTFAGDSRGCMSAVMGRSAAKKAWADGTLREWQQPVERVDADHEDRLVVQDQGPLRSSQTPAMPALRPRRPSSSAV